LIARVTDGPHKCRPVAYADDGVTGKRRPLTMPSRQER